MVVAWGWVLVTAARRGDPLPHEFPSESLDEALDTALAEATRRGANVSMHRTALLEAFSPVRLQALAEQQAGPYRAAGPFPHLSYDGLIPDSVLRQVSDELPEKYHARSGCHVRAQFCLGNRPEVARIPGSNRKLKYTGIQRRSAIDKERFMGPATVMLFRALKSKCFRKYLTQVTGIGPLFADPYFAGAGAHFAAPGARLQVHADFNKVYNMHRRVNLFVYLNDDWPEHYGGHLQLWNRAMTKCEGRILPTWNRLVYFSSTDFSYHGHPEPLGQLPANRMRRALVLYFYTNGTRPREECFQPDERCEIFHNTLFQSPSGCTSCSDCSGSPDRITPVALDKGGMFVSRANMSLSDKLSTRSIRRRRAAHLGRSLGRNGMQQSIS